MTKDVPEVAGRTNKSSLVTTDGAIVGVGRGVIVGTSVATCDSEALVLWPVPLSLLKIRPQPHSATLSHNMPPRLRTAMGLFMLGS